MPEKKDCSFLLKETKATKPTPINFHMTCPDEPVKRGISESILPADWDFSTQRAKGDSKAARRINQLIDSITSMIPGIKSECRRTNKVISSDDIHAALDVILQDRRPETKAPTVQAMGMIADIKSIIAGMKDGSITTPKKKKKYASTTIDNYEKVTLVKIEKYYKEKKKAATWESVTMDLYNDFISWCHAYKLSSNSIGGYIRNWKVVGKIALNRSMHSNGIFKDEKFMGMREETPAIYLDDAKIEKIYRQNYNDKEMEASRDWAILDCYLGLRISDLINVSDNDFTGGMFQFVNQKTGAHVAIPIHRFAREILTKRKGLPPAIKEHIFRQNIKDIACDAGLKEKFIYVATIGGEVQKIEYEEWECVSPHTFRRSFITNLLKMGIPHAKVMKLAGIKRYETLMRYFKQTAMDVAKDVSDHHYFK